MSAEMAVVGSLATIFFGLAWVSFKFMDSHSELMKYLGVLFMAMSVMILQVTAWTALELAANTASITWFTGAGRALLIMTNAIMIIVWFALFIRAFYSLARLLLDGVRKHIGKEDFFE